MSPLPRVRFAPSPTGFFHIGSARTALYNWLYARHTGGTFILRIEDTDVARNDPAYEQLIFDSLRWLGMDWDEGPDVGGPVGPYRQSERTAVYDRYLDILRQKGRAYDKDGFCFFRLEGPRVRAFDPHQQRTREYVKAAPAPFEDLISGRIARSEDQDFVLRRANGNYTFHFTNVVDDIEMRITHVIRGMDHMSNTTKHVELLNAFGHPLPIYAHIPLILNPDGKKKMSKSERGALIMDYQRQGFLPQALVNFLALLGWSNGTNQEKFSAAELVTQFDLSAVRQTNARFDYDKMLHINGLHLADLTPAQYTALASHVLPGLDLSTVQAQAFLALARPKILDMQMLPVQIEPLLNPEYCFNPEAVSKLKITLPLATLHPEFVEFNAGLPQHFTEQEAYDLLKVFAAARGRKPTEYIHAGRYFLTGQCIGLSFFAILEHLTAEQRNRRLQRATEMLRNTK